MFYHIRVEVKELWRTESEKERKNIQKGASFWVKEFWREESRWVVFGPRELESIRLELTMW